MSEESKRLRVSEDRWAALNAWAKSNGLVQQAATDKAIDEFLKRAKKTKS